MSVIFYHSPLGIIEIVFSKNSISSLQFVNQLNTPLTDSIEEIDIVSGKSIIQFLDNYFLAHKPDLSMNILSSGSSFHLDIMSKIQKIPYGQHITYSDLASQLGLKNAVRAIANSLGKNKVLILNPCHRITGKHNQGGYKAGVWRKKYLLALEQGDLKNLGLNIKAVHLNENMPAWKELYEIEKEAILSICDVKTEQIAHIGSTFIPNFISKPIIDIMLGINPEQENEILSRLKLIGWHYKANFDPKEWHYLAKGVGDFITHHLHVCHYNSVFFKQHIAFRDILVNHPEILKQYENLKTNLKSDFAQERKAYTQAKSDFIFSVLQKFGY